MTRVRAGLSGALALFALALGACPHEVIAPPADALTDARAVIALVADRPGPRTAAIEARATQYGDSGAFKGKLTILVERPASVHFSALSPTDDVVSVLVTDGERFTTFERGASTCYVGRACPENVGRLLPLALEPSELAGALLGRPPLIAHGDAAATWDGRVGAYRLDLSGSGGLSQRLWVAHGSGEVRRAQLLEAGRVTVDLRYDDWAAAGAYRMPRRLDVTMKRGDVDLRLVYREIDLDLDLDRSAFTLPCPAKSEVLTLPCDGAAPPAPAAPVPPPREDAP